MSLNRRLQQGKMAKESCLKTDSQETIHDTLQGNTNLVTRILKHLRRGSRDLIHSGHRNRLMKYSGGKILYYKIVSRIIN